MNRKNNRRKALWIILFVVLVGIGGFALAATGHLESPLDTLISGGERERGGPPQGFTSQDNSTQPQRETAFRGEGGQQSGINWSHIGDVLYNVWFLFAAAAIIIVVQTVGGSIKQMVKFRLSKAASP